jgi:two-component system, LytTR family, sensor kinase
MTVRFTRDRLILYATITVVFLIHWIYNDLILNPEAFLVSLLNNTWRVIYVVGANLLYFEYVLPHVTSRKRNRLIAIIASIVLHLAAFMIGLYGWRALGMFIGAYNPFNPASDSVEAILSIARFTPGVFLLFAVFKLFFDYTQLRYEGQQIRLERKNAELLFLKSQINPHFLFNTLNNIYSLSQYKPNLVSESVLRLSKILRYLLYETGNEFITVEKEIRILTDYIDLEKLRYSESVMIDFSHDIDDFSEMMPPLLLLPLVENAFKHGVSVSRGKRFVDVRCVVRERKLNFVVKNSIPTTVVDSGSPNDESKGNIGLSNLRRRLELLYKDFELITEQKDSVFTAALKINLSSHV